MGSSSTNRSQPSLSLLMVTCSSSDLHRRRRLGREDHRCCPYRLLSQPSSVFLPSLLRLLRTTQCPIRSSFPSNQPMPGVLLFLPNCRHHLHPSPLVAGSFRTAHLFAFFLGSPTAVRGGHHDPFAFSGDHSSPVVSLQHPFRPSFPTSPAAPSSASEQAGLARADMLGRYLVLVVVVLVRPPTASILRGRT